MRAYQILSMSSSACATLASSVPVQNATASVHPILTPIFVAHVLLGKVVGPIPIYGGVRVVEPVTGGDISGHALNGTLSAGGSAAIGIYVNQTVHQPFVEVWGKTDDNVPFFVQVEGIGAVNGQFASAKISIGGRYAYLENEFILASLTDNEAQPPTEATVQGWIVSRD